MATGTWNNPDGLLVKFAQYYQDPANTRNRATNLKRFGSDEEMEIVFDLTQLPAGTTSFTTDINNDGVKDGFNTGDSRFPANSVLTGGYLVMTEAAVGGTSMTVGTYQLNGTAVNATGILTATAGAVANLNAVGKRTTLDGALVTAGPGVAGVGTLAAYAGITTQGTFTAGKGRMIIRYVLGPPDVDTTR